MRMGIFRARVMCWVFLYDIFNLYINLFTVLYGCIIGASIPVLYIPVYCIILYVDKYSGCCVNSTKIYKYIIKTTGTAVPPVNINIQYTNILLYWYGIS